MELAQTQQVAAAMSEYAFRHGGEAPSRRPSSAVVYSAEFLLPSGRRHVGGYADRLKGLLSTALLAMLCDRTFAVQWDTPHPIQAVFDPGAYAWAMTLDMQASPTPTVVDGIDDPAHARFRTQLLGRADVFDRLHGHEHLIKVHSNIEFIDDLLANPSLCARTRLGRLLATSITTHGRETVSAWLFGTLFRFLFRYTPRGVVGDAWLRFLHVRQSRTLVGLQFRTGGGGQWLDPSLDSLANANRIAQVAVDAAMARDFEDPVFFISSDSTAASVAMADALRARHEVLHFGFPPAHFERSASLNSLLQAEAPVLEHTCLAHCDLVVHGRGGFGTTAARIGGIPALPYRDD